VVKAYLFLKKMLHHVFEVCNFLIMKMTHFSCKYTHTQRNEQGKNLILISELLSIQKLLYFPLEHEHSSKCLVCFVIHIDPMQFPVFLFSMLYQPTYKASKLFQLYVFIKKWLDVKMKMASLWNKTWPGNLRLSTYQMIHLLWCQRVLWSLQM